MSFGNDYLGRSVAVQASLVGDYEVVGTCTQGTGCWTIGIVVDATQIDAIQLPCDGTTVRVKWRPGKLVSGMVELSAAGAGNPPESQGKADLVVNPAR